MKDFWFKQRMVWWPTWRLWSLGLVLAGLTAYGLTARLYPWLGLSRPVQANILVVEGWVPDYILSASTNVFYQGGYERLCTSGGPVNEGFYIAGIRDYAELASLSLEKMQFPKDRLIPAPAGPTRRHRTFESARHVRRTLLQKGYPLRGINVLTEGPHARRTWTVYQKVFGPEVPIGIISLEPRNYDPKRWWGSSDGIKTVVMEAIGWLYEAILDSGRSSS